MTNLPSSDAFSTNVQLPVPATSEMGEGQLFPLGSETVTSPVGPSRPGPLTVTVIVTGPVLWPA